MPSAEIKDYNVMADEHKNFDQPVKNNIRTYNDILKITAGQGDDYTVVYYFIPNSMNIIRWYQ